MKKGFTLVELLAVIILLGLLGLIIYPTVNGVINNNKEKLHDKQIEELIRHADSYATYNMSKLRAYDGSRNIVTFTDLYEAGIIQSDKVVDPSNDEELTGCMALTWNEQRQTFDIEYTNNCVTSVSLSGKITGSDASNAKVRLVANNESLYETTTDESGNYSFNGILPSKYILLVSQPYKTKYGREVEVYEDTVKSMAIELFKGDFNDNNVIDEEDVSFAKNCVDDVPLRRIPACFDESKGLSKSFYDFNNDGFTNNLDKIAFTNINRPRKVSNITLSGTANIKGRIQYDGTTKPTITLNNNDNTYTATLDSNGNFSFNNITRGIYYFEAKKDSYTIYGKYIYLDKDIENINAYLYAGDVTQDGIINKDDINDIIWFIEDDVEPTSYDFKLYDLNNDGIIDNNDVMMIQRNLGKKSIYE